MKQEINTKFFHFRQNDSGGSWDIDLKKGITVNVIIEALDYEHANCRAEEIGIEFYTGCPCCGDRWAKQWSIDQGDDEPMVYNSLVSKYENEWWHRDIEKQIAIHYIDGAIELH